MSSVILTMSLGEAQALRKAASGAFIKQSQYLRSVMDGIIHDHMIVDGDVDELERARVESELKVLDDALTKLSYQIETQKS